MSELERIVGTGNIVSPLSRDDSISVNTEKINELIKGQQILQLLLGPKNYVASSFTHLDHGRSGSVYTTSFICGYNKEQIKQYLIISGKEPEIWEVYAYSSNSSLGITLKLVTDEALSRIKTYAQALNCIINANAPAPSSGSIKAEWLKW